MPRLYRSIGVMAVVTTLAGVTVAAQAPQVRTFASVLQIMKTMTIPFSDAVFAAAGEAPKTDEAWTKVEEQSLALAEAGNLLMLGSRVRDRGDWLTLTQAMVTAAEGAARAASAKNADDLSTKSDALYETCTNCHNKYMKK